MALVTMQENKWEAAERFTPAANQDQFRSAWAVIDGTPGPGWNTVAELEAPQQYSEIRSTGSGYSIWKDGKGKDHRVKVGNMTLVEMVVPAEEMAAKEKLEGQVSSNRITNIVDSADQNYVALGGGVEQPLQNHGQTETGIDTAALQETLFEQQNKLRTP